MGFKSLQNNLLIHRHCQTHLSNDRITPRQKGSLIKCTWIPAFFRASGTRALPYLNQLAPSAYPPDRTMERFLAFKLPHNDMIVSPITMGW